MRIEGQRVPVRYTWSGFVDRHGKPERFDVIDWEAKSGPRVICSVSCLERDPEQVRATRDAALRLLDLRLSHPEG